MTYSVAIWQSFMRVADIDDDDISLLGSIALVPGNRVDVCRHAGDGRVHQAWLDRFDSLCRRGLATIVDDRHRDFVQGIVNDPTVFTSGGDGGPNRQLGIADLTPAGGIIVSYSSFLSTGGQISYWGGTRECDRDGTYCHLLFGPSRDGVDRPPRSPNSKVVIDQVPGRFRNRWWATPSPAWYRLERFTVPPVDPSPPRLYDNELIRFVDYLEQHRLSEKEKEQHPKPSSYSGDFRIVSTYPGMLAFAYFSSDGFESIRCIAVSPTKTKNIRSPRLNTFPEFMRIQWMVRGESQRRHQQVDLRGVVPCDAEGTTVFHLDEQGTWSVTFERHPAPKATVEEIE